jgi:hypothetical protein
MTRGERATVVLACGHRRLFKNKTWAPAVGVTILCTDCDDYVIVADSPHTPIVLRGDRGTIDQAALALGIPVAQLGHLVATRYPGERATLDAHGRWLVEFDLLERLAKEASS